MINITLQESYNYIIIGLVLSYIWYIYDISIRYLIPFLILIIVIIVDQYNKISSSSNNKHNPILPESNDILKFLDDIIKLNFNKYNPQVYKELIKSLNKFYNKPDIYYLHIIINIFNSFIYSLPIEYDEILNIKVNELKKILLSKLEEIPIKYKHIEMQQYIPYNFNQDIDYYV
jgi:hypothetical protein